MQPEKENPKFVEDDFDLEEFSKRFAKLRRLNAEIRANKKILLLLKIAIVVLIISGAFFAYRSIKYYFELKRNAMINEMIQEISAEEPQDFVTEEENAGEVTSDITEPAPLPDESITEAEEPVIEENKVVIDKIIKLREAFSNEDIVAYLKIDDTNIDYTVVQSTDNDFYLERDLYGNKNVAGSIFMDYESDPYEISKNTVLYGHNMRNGSMFHNIRYYNDFEFFKEHRFISLTLPYGETVWEVFSYYKTSQNFYYIQVIFPTDRAFASLVSEMKRRSAYDTGVEVGVEDKILTLSTCANTPSDERLVVNAKLIEIK